MICSRSKYKPLQARQLGLQYLLLLFSIPTQITANHIYGIYDSEWPFGQCKPFFGIFFFFGVSPIMAILIYRLQRIFFIVILRKIPSGFIFWTPIFLPLVVNFGLIFMPVNGVTECQQLLGTIFYFSFFVPLTFQIVLYCYYTFMLRNLKKAFNEYRDLKITCIMVVSMLILNGFWILGPIEIGQEWKKILLVLTVTFGCSGFIIGVILSPLYAYFFNSIKYEKQFEKSLRYEKLLFVSKADYGISLVQRNVVVARDKEDEEELPETIKLIL